MTTPPPYVIPSDSPSVFDSLSVLSKQAIVRPNNPPPGIAGWLFDIPGDEELRLRSIITRHYVEDNTPVQDMIALEPEEIKLGGVVAELTTGLPSTPNPTVVASTLPLNLGILPTASLGTLIQVVGLVGSVAPSSSLAIASGLVVAAASAAVYAANRAQASAIANSASQAAAQIFNATTTVPASAYGYQQATAPLPPGQTRQANAANFLYQLWKGRMLFSVETPFGIMNNMAILDARFLQEAQSRERSNFTLTFQKVRVVGAPVQASMQFDGRRSLQTSPPTQNGTTGLTPVTPTMATSLYQGIA